METTDFKIEAEYIESMADSLACHLALFENTYGKPDTGPKAAITDSDTFFRSLSDIVEKSEKVDAHLKNLVGMMYGKE